MGHRSSRARRQAGFGEANFVLEQKLQYSELLEPLEEISLGCAFGSLELNALNARLICF